MSISAVNGTDARALFYQRRLDFKALTAEVQAGDATAAQAALQSYQKDVQAIASAAAPTDAADSSAPSDFVTRIKTDLSNLTSAVQSGNMTDAQTALTAYENDRYTKPAPAPSSDAASSFVSDLTSLIQSVQSGDANGVKTSSAALAKDVQSLSQPGGAHGAHHHHHHHAGPAPTDTDGATQTSSLGDPTDQNGTGTTGSAASSSNPLSAQAAALDQFVKQFTESLEQFEQSMQQRTV